VYDLRIHHDEVIGPILRNVRALERTGLSGDGEAAQVELAEFVANLDSSATRFTERRDSARERQAARVG
jgi:acyl-[acyl-carrier-protein] desaturase